MRFHLVALALLFLAGAEALDATRTRRVNALERQRLNSQAQLQSSVGIDCPNVDSFKGKGNNVNACKACVKVNVGLSTFDRNCYWVKDEATCRNAFWSAGSNYIKDEPECGAVDTVDSNFPVDSRMKELRKELEEFSPVDVFLMNKDSAAGLLGLLAVAVQEQPNAFLQISEQRRDPPVTAPSAGVPVAPPVKDGNLVNTPAPTPKQPFSPKLLAKTIYDRSCSKVTAVISTCTELLGWNAWASARDARNALKRTLALDTCNLFGSIAAAVPVLGDAVAKPTAIICSGLTLINDAINMYAAQKGLDDASELMFVIKTVLEQARRLSTSCTTFNLLFSDKPADFLRQARPRTLQPKTLLLIKKAIHDSFCGLIDLRMANHSLTIKAKTNPNTCKSVDVSTTDPVTLLQQLEVVQLTGRERACAPYAKASKDFETAFNNYINAVYSNASGQEKEIASFAVSKAYQDCYSTTEAAVYPVPAHVNTPGGFSQQ